MTEKKLKIFENITIVIVLYNSSEVIFKLLKNLINFKIIIVDNGKNEEVIKKIEKNKSIQKIIRNKKNLGFGTGVNSTIDFIKTDYFLMLNPDCLVEEDSIISMYETAEKYNSAAVGPWMPDDKNCYGIFPEKGKGIVRNSNQTRCTKILENQKPSGNFCVDVHKSAVLLINKKNFKEVNMFNEKFFLFWEEIDLCKKFREKKFSIILSPEVIASHKGSGSTKNDLYTYIIRIYHHELSPLIYFKVNRFSKILYWRLFKYLFRTVSYFLILNIKKSLKNFLKFLATFNYILKLN